MRQFLVQHFVKDPENIRNPAVRQQYGRLSSVVGIVLNVLLFIAKFTVGTLFHSVSITGDAVNNLSDAGSSVISLVSFKLSGKPADKDHPFGHARIEYIASSVVALLILLIGVELLKSSIGKIRQPDAIDFSLITVVVLLLSIAVKGWLYFFNRRLGKKIQSDMMQATATDSLTDVLATSAVLVSTVVSPIIHFQLDGYMGAAVAVFIMFSGFRILKGTLDRILGQVPSEELVRSIGTRIRQYEGVLGLHDLIVHEYGPNRNFASVHVEVDAKAYVLASHEIIDHIERDFAIDAGIQLVVHMDPVSLDDPRINELRQLAAQVVTGIDSSLTLHDFRIVRSLHHDNLIFDVMVPYPCKLSDYDLLQRIQDQITAKDNSLRVVVTFDRSFV